MKGYKDCWNEAGKLLKELFKSTLLVTCHKEIRIPKREDIENTIIAGIKLIKKKLPAIHGVKGCWECIDSLMERFVLPDVLIPQLGLLYLYYDQIDIQHKEDIVILFGCSVDQLKDKCIKIL